MIPLLAYAGFAALALAMDRHLVAGAADRVTLTVALMLTCLPRFLGGNGAANRKRR